MPHKQSAKKHLRQTKKRTARNKQTKERIKDAVKKIEKLVVDKKLDEAKALLPKLTKMLDKAAKTRVIHTNKARRFKSKLTSKVSKK